MTCLVRWIPSSLRAGAVGLLAVLTIVLSAPPTRASSLSVVFNPSSVTVSPGGSGILEMDLVNTGGTFDLAGFNINIDVPSTSGVSFTGGDANSTAPYILAGDSAGPIVTNPNGNPYQIELNDLANDLDHPVGTGTFGLARFFFDVAPGTPLGPVTVTIDPLTTFADPNFNPISVDLSATGTILVGGPSVPEPPTVILAGTGLLVVIGACYRRRRRAAAA